MFIVTNRSLNLRTGTFGPILNPNGPNELRVAEAVRTRNGWKINHLPDQITRDMKKEVGLRGDVAFGSAYVARKLLSRINPFSAKVLGLKTSGKFGKNLALFVHAFNNDVEAVLDQARSWETSCGVEVLLFTWPANAGGVVGAASRTIDRRDALASVGALGRVLQLFSHYVDEFTHGVYVRAIHEAQMRFPKDPGKAMRHFARTTARYCPFGCSLVIHGMGAYLYKYVLLTSDRDENRAVFDNVLLVGPEVSNENAARWISRIQCKNQIYITFNEQDSTFVASGVGSRDEGQSQLGRKGLALESSQATYVDFSNTRGVGNSSTYFMGRPMSGNASVKRFFRDAVNGANGHLRLPYDSAKKAFAVP